MPNLAATQYFAYNPMYGSPPVQHTQMQYGEQYGEYGHGHYPQQSGAGLSSPIELPQTQTPMPMEKSEWERLHPEVLPPSPGLDQGYHSEMVEMRGEKYPRTP
jgi:hypothetical protein